MPLSERGIPSYALQKCKLIPPEKLANTQNPDEESRQSFRKAILAEHQQQIKEIEQEFSSLGIISAFKHLINEHTLPFNSQDNPKNSRPSEQEDLRITKHGAFWIIARGLKIFENNDVNYKDTEESYLAIGVLKDKAKGDYKVGFFVSPTTRLVFAPEAENFNVPFSQFLHTKKSDQTEILRTLNKAVDVYKLNLEQAKSNNNHKEYLPFP
jgi:hypothetical protein